MATLVLTALGTAVGGPLGGAIGAVIGGVVDREILFKPKGREGPRLKELDVQTSRYGAPISQLFGTMRVAGQVVWATDLKETRSTEGGGKGQPSLTSYAYSASFAVLLSARPVVAVRRIWADGTLLRGDAGDWKVRTRFRLHAGGEAQAPDPLIVAAEGAGAAPALRGCAYVVFEDLPLATFGNRIPSLTFEVEADAGPVTIGRIVTDLSGGRVACAIPATVGGYAGHGDSVAAAVEPLAALSPIAWRAEAGGLRAVAPQEPATRLAGDGADAEGKRAVRIERERRPVESVPRRAQIMHYDPARDYQTGSQAATRGGAGRIESRIDMPAALDAGAARAAAEAMLARALSERERRRVRMPWAPDTPRPGDVVTVAGDPARWRVARVDIERMVATLSLIRIATTAMPSLPASPGRAVPSPDLPVGPTSLHVFEMPPGDIAETTPRLIVAAGGGPGWRGAALSVSGDGGATWQAMAGGRPGPVVGTVETAMAGDASPALIDRRSAPVVRLADPRATLGDADADAIDAGANAAMIGGEMIQFERATPLGEGRWRLHGLHRGRRGSDAAIAGHGAGEGFALLDAGLPAVAMDVAVGTVVRAMAEGAGDAVPAEAAAIVGGAALLPPAPVHLAAAWRSDGRLVSWTRRSRAGWRWRDGADAPLVEERERYAVTVARGGEVIATAECDAPAWVLDAALLAGGAVTVAVRQMGTHGTSPAATMLIS